MKIQHALATILTTTAAAAVLGGPAFADPRPDTYTLDGDAGAPAGSKFEGIGVDRTGGTFYVSETTGGELHRGRVGQAGAEVWVDGDGTDGRWTARGVTVDGAGRVYVAGGPNRLDHPGAPDLWVYAPGGSLLAALQVPAGNAFLNDVAIGPDGAAYFTDSNAARIYRVAPGTDGWRATTWADASAVIAQAPGFNLGGIVLTGDRQAFVVAQGNVGKLWRFDIATQRATLVDTTGADLAGADGLVLQGDTLLVVRNFQRHLTSLTLAEGATQATLLHDEASDPSRVFTTAKVSRGRLLIVDSKFDEPVASAPYQVVSIPWHDAVS
ncbi:MAG: gluconolaconase [Nocardioidaceae bacterium]|nr:gluconolaconase [Nocardioidaceae bacterium]